MAFKKIEKNVRVLGASRVNLVAKTAAMYEEGKSIRELAAMYGRSYGFVYRLLAESEVVMRGRGGSNRAK